jgi:alkaline phosphatase D
MGGHGYAVVTAKAEGLAVEFVCIPRPINPVLSRDGGPLRYRVIHTVQRWRAGERPRLEQRFIEGQADLSI